MGKLPDRIANADGTPTLEFIIWADELTGGADNANLGTLLSGINTAQAGVNGIVAGTTPLTKVIISGRGDVANELDAVNTNVSAAAAAAGGGGTLAASVGPTWAYGSTSGGGSATTGNITVTASGGTAPYTYLWEKITGDTISVNSATAATTSFSGTPGPGADLFATFRCTVTDDVSATIIISVGVTIIDFT